MHPEDYLEKLLQFGFAAVMALLLVYVIWKIVSHGIDTYHQMYTEHKKDITNQQEEHREERKECYAAHAEVIDKFDRTLINIAKHMSKG